MGRGRGRSGRQPVLAERPRITAIIGLLTGSSGRRLARARRGEPQPVVIHGGGQSANSTAAVSSRMAASEESLPTVLCSVVSFLLIDQFAMSRTKASVNPPAAIPKISGTYTPNPNFL